MLCRFILSIVIIGAAHLVSSIALAAWPERAIMLNLPYPPDVGTDIVARALRSAA